MASKWGAVDRDEALKPVEEAMRAAGVPIMSRIRAMADLKRQLDAEDAAWSQVLEVYWTGKISP